MAGTLVVVGRAAIVRPDLHRSAREAHHCADPIRRREPRRRDTIGRMVRRATLELHGLQDRLAVLRLVLGDHAIRRTHHG